MRKQRLRKTKKLLQDPTVGKNRTGIEPSLSEAKVSHLYQIAFLCSRGLVKTSGIKHKQLIYLPIVTIYSIYFTKVNLYRNRFQEKSDTMILPFAASLTLILEFLRTATGPTHTVSICS